MEWFTKALEIANGALGLWWHQLTTSFSHGSIIAGIIFFIFDLCMFPVALGAWFIILFFVATFFLICTLFILFFKLLWWLIRLPFCLLFKHEPPEF